MRKRYTNKEKQDFIQRRAAGESVRNISIDTGISRATLETWGRKFSAQIEEAKRQELADLAKEYGIAKHARIERLAGTLQKVSESLKNADFNAVSPEKLASIQLQYMQALKAEFAELEPVQVSGAITPEIINNALADLLKRSRAGDISKDQAASESTILINMLKVYEVQEIQIKVEELQKLVEQLQEKAAAEA